jgi:Lar family restriction alleviation protein
MPMPLKPCPFCGAKSPDVAVLTFTDDTRQGRHTFAVTCKVCGVRGPTSSRLKERYQRLIEAHETWNRRA